MADCFHDKSVRVFGFVFTLLPNKYTNRVCADVQCNVCKCWASLDTCWYVAENLKTPCDIDPGLIRTHFDAKYLGSLEWNSPDKPLRIEKRENTE